MNHWSSRIESGFLAFSRRNLLDNIERRQKFVVTQGKKQPSFTRCNGWNTAQMISLEDATNWNVSKNIIKFFHVSMNWLVCRLKPPLCIDLNKLRARFFGAVLLNFQWEMYCQIYSKIRYTTRTSRDRTWYLVSSYETVEKIF